MLKIIQLVKPQQSTQKYTTPDDDKIMIKSAWAKDVGPFLYHLDPDTRKIIRSVYVNIYIYIYIIIIIMLCLLHGFSYSPSPLHSIVHRFRQVF